jgi:hypothetical protein
MSITITTQSWQGLMLGREGKARRFFCNKEGRCDSKNIEKKTKKGSARIGCKGHLKAKLDRKGDHWYYDIVDLKHNHKLTPEK